MNAFSNLTRAKDELEELVQSELEDDYDELKEDFAK